MTKELSPQEVCKDVLKEKYFSDTKEECYDRVSYFLGNSKEEQESLRKAFDMGLLGAGRIMASAGRLDAEGNPVGATLINCFVQPVSDAVEEGDDSIYNALRDSATTMRLGGGVGYDFSALRPKGAIVNSTNSPSSGVCSFIDIFDKSCGVLEAAGCLAGDSRIETDKGLIKIEEIVNSDEDFYAMTHLGLRKVTHKFKNGIKKVYRVTTEYGHTCDMTLDHKVAHFQNGEIVTSRLEDVMNSDQMTMLLIADQTEIVPSWNQEEKLAYLIGAFQGNGSYFMRTNVAGETYPSGIRFSYNSETKQDISDRVMEIIQSFGYNVSGSKRAEENTFEITSNTLGLAEWMVSLAGPKGDDLDVPEYIFKSSPSERCAYLAGLLDADGHFSNKKSNIRLRMISTKLLKSVQVLYSSLGIPAKYCFERAAKGNWKELWNVAIYGSFAQERFQKTVGRFCVQKLEKTANRDVVGYGHFWKDIEGFPINKRDFRKKWHGDTERTPKISLSALNIGTELPELMNTVSAKITNVEYLGEMETFDLEVEEVHKLSANGIYLSNSRRGAQLCTIVSSHPDLLDFITAKREKGRWNNFNVSVGITDDFMRALENDEDWEFYHEKGSFYEKLPKKVINGKEVFIWGKTPAREIWEKILRSNYEFAEPGVLYIDTINKRNPLWYAEKITATNPCGV